MQQGQKTAKLNALSGWSSDSGIGRKGEAAEMVACRFLTVREASEMYGIDEHEIVALQQDRCH